VIRRIALISMSVLACRASDPVERTSGVGRVVRDTARVAKDTVRLVSTAAFRDTALVPVSLAEAHEFPLRAPGQRDALLATLRRERGLWRTLKPRDYQFLLRVDCFCPGRRGWLLMEVRIGQLSRAWDAAGKPAALSDWNTFSIDTLFDMLERAAGMDGVVQVAFDPRWHFPADVRTVRLPGPDAWTVIDARGFRPLTDGK